MHSGSDHIEELKKRLVVKINTKSRVAQQRATMVDKVRFLCRCSLFKFRNSASLVLCRNFYSVSGTKRLQLSETYTKNEGKNEHDWIYKQFVSEHWMLTRKMYIEFIFEHFLWENRFVLFVLYSWWNFPILFRFENPLLIRRCHWQRQTVKKLCYGAKSFYYWRPMCRVDTASAWWR